MRGLDITQANLTNQQGVVGNEVKVNVLNQPYGSFPWIDLPMAAFTNWYNSHNFYGDLKDIEAATLEDAKAFATKYYQPQNAVLVVVGDFNETDAKRWVEKYFGNIPSQKTEPLPDLTEPRQEAERTVTRVDKLAEEAGGRIRVSNAETRHAGILRYGPDRPDHDPGRRQPAL
jgi:predicted Zn-dependent peptidase